MSSPSPPQSLLIMSANEASASHKPKKAPKKSKSNTEEFLGQQQHQSQPWSLSNFPNQRVSLPNQPAQYLPSASELQSINTSSNASLLKSMAYYNPVMMMNLLAAASSSSTSSPSTSSAPTSAYTSSSSSSSCSYTSASNLDTSPTEMAGAKKSSRFVDENANEVSLSALNSTNSASTSEFLANKSYSSLIMLMMMSKCNMKNFQQPLNQPPTQPLPSNSAAGFGLANQMSSPNRAAHVKQETNEVRGETSKRAVDKKTNFAIISTLIN